LETVTALEEKVARIEGQRLYFEKRFATEPAATARIRKQRSKARKLVRMGSELDWLEADTAMIEKDCSGQTVARLGFAVFCQRRAVGVLRSGVEVMKQKIARKRKEISELRENIMLDGESEASLTIETLESHLQLEGEVHERLEAELAVLEAEQAVQPDVATLEAQLLKAEDRWAEARERYVTLIRSQRKEVVEMEGSAVVVGKQRKRRLLVGLFERQIDAKKLERLFRGFGAVESVRVARARGSTRQYVARVQFHREEDAGRALSALNNTEFLGQRIIVRWAGKQPGQPMEDEMRSTPDVDDGID
jgi:hypothetical protein